MNQRRGSLIGSDFKGMGDLSAFGRLYRISRLNSLTVRQAIDVMGIDKRVRGYLERHAAFPWPGGGVWDQMTTPRRAKPTKVCDLVPYLVERNMDINEQIRGCRSCLRAGFHAMVHQLPWIDLCPWHREPLIDRCECGRRLLDGARDTGNVLLLCRCGHDFYDRLDALESITHWPSRRAKAFVAKRSKSAKASRETHQLKVDLDLSLDEAIAAAIGTLFPARHLITTDVNINEINDDRESQHRAIAAWHPLDIFPSYPRNHLIPLLRVERSNLKNYLHGLYLRIASSPGEFSKRAFNEQGSELTLHGVQVDSIEGVDHRWISHRDHNLARQVAECFINKHSASQSDSYIGRNDRLQSVLEDPSIDLRGLAGTLSVIAMQAFMEQALHLVWSWYSMEQLPSNLRARLPEAVMFAPGGRFGHPIAVLSSGEAVASRLIRVLSAPEFLVPPETLSGDYARPTQRHRRDKPAFHWT